MTAKGHNKFAALKKMSLFTKPSSVLKSVAAGILMLAVSTPVTQAQSNNIVESVTENSAQGRVSLGGGSDCNRIENVTSPVRAGQQAFKHWVDRCGKRAELEMKPTKIGETYWLGWSMYVPTGWANSSDWYDIVAQWATYPPSLNRKFKEQGCGAVGSYMVIHGDTLRFHHQHQGQTTDTQCDKYVLGNINDIKGKWIDFVMHSKWTGNSDGFLKLWMKVGNDAYVQTVNYTGSTFWNDEGRGPYFKMGIYKGNTNWKGPGAPRYLYTDEYRLGNGDSSFAGVAPGNAKGYFGQAY